MSARSDSFYARALGLVVLAGYFIHALATPSDWHFIDAVDLIFHEAGHAIFMEPIFGTFIHVFMGSGFQVLLPLAISGYFLWTHQRLGAGVALMWAGQSLANVSVYAGDAIAMQLPLLGGDSSGHDWNWLLSTTHLLGYTHEIATGILALGWLALIAGIIVACLGLQEDISDPEFHTK